MIAAEVERLIGPGSAERLDLEALETCLRRRVLAFGAQLAAQRLNQDHSDRVGPSLACDCGGEARYAGRSAKTFETVLGPLKLERAYYHCQGCGHGFFPRDRHLGMEGTSLSPGVVRMTGSAAGRVSFAEASDLLGELAGVGVGAKQVERTAEALGREIAAAEGEAGGFEPEPAAAPTMYLGMDGTGVPVRKTETVGRAGKQPDGSARTGEVKLVLVWTAERLDRKTGSPERDAGSVSCSAAIESAASRDTDPEPSVFARRVRGEAERRGFSLARRRVVLGDGARLDLAGSRGGVSGSDSDRRPVSREGASVDRLESPPWGGPGSRLRLGRSPLRRTGTGPPRRVAGRPAVGCLL